MTWQEAFHQMLFWESDHPSYGEFHHLMVLCYHLQHPSLYSPEGLQYGMRLLVNFLERDVTPERACHCNASRVGSGRRAWKIKGTANSRGLYPHPINWQMTACEVLGRGEERYPASVREWARSVLENLRESGNLFESGNL
jgi:hypothetical protein